MKKIFLFVAIFVSLQSFAQTNGDYAGYIKVKDTLTNAQSYSDTVTITGPKHNITFQVNVIKISGTVAGSINVYGSADGVTYGTTALTTTALTDATANYLISYTTNAYKKYRIVRATTGTSAASERVYLLYRK